MERTTAATEATRMPRTAPSLRLTTTLYDLIAVLQDMTAPDNGASVVATVVYLLQSGRLTWEGRARAPLNQMQHTMTRGRQHGSPYVT
jgi:hypothetical protein